MQKAHFIRSQPKRSGTEKRLIAMPGETTFQGTGDSFAKVANQISPSTLPTADTQGIDVQ